MIDITPSLELDNDSMNPAELSMPALMRELSLQKRPNWILRTLMNALEKKRQAKGLGWSRAWNKYGINVFRTHTINTIEDIEYVFAVQSFIESFLKTAQSDYRAFAQDLLFDPECLAFTFYHNNDIDGQQHEGLTLSFGRKVKTDRSKRDRLDIVIEDERINGKVDGLADRLRIYVCPWDHYQNDREHLAIVKDDFQPNEQTQIQELYLHCLNQYDHWKDDESRQWGHWSAQFIDYFGPRTFIPQGSSFS